MKSLTALGGLNNDGLDPLFVDPDSASERGATIPFGGDLATAGNYARVNGEPTSTTSSSSNEETEAVVPVAGTIDRVSVSQQNTTCTPLSRCTARCCRRVTCARPPRTRRR